MRLQPIEDRFSVLVPEQNDVRRLLPAREPYAHKGDFGKVLLFAGSCGMAGAAALSGRAALRSGAEQAATSIIAQMATTFKYSKNSTMLWRAKSEKHMPKSASVMTSHAIGNVA